MNNTKQKQELIIRMSISNKPYVILLCLMSLLSISCEDTFLDEENLSGATTSLYRTADGFEKGVNRAYAGARDLWGQESGAIMTDIGTDIWTNGRGGSAKYFSTYEPQLNSEADYVEDMWADLYGSINAINTVLAAAPEITGMDTSLKEARIGELKFLRAFYYFLLTRWHGPVPLHLEPVTGVDTEESRSPLPEIYTAIIKDLEDAVAVLPTEQPDWGRATKGAAQHLMALVYLTRGYEMDNSSDFNKAADLAMTVINSGRYKLLDDFDDWFDINNQINEEVIWSVQYAEDVRINGAGNGAHLFYTSAYDELPGMLRDIENGRPWNRLKPTPFLYDLYDISKDSRYDKSFKTVWYTNNPGTYEINSQEVTLAVGDTAVWMPHPAIDPQNYQDKPYTVIPPNEYYASFSYFPTLRKHLDPTRPSVQWAAGFRDFIVLRLGETYLIAAEALYQAGNLTEAALYLNALRERAAWPGFEAQMQIKPTQVTLDFILDEWARETAGEYQRWFTLVRTARLVERVRAHNSWAAPNIEPYHALRPIPQAQIDAVTTEFEQNTGY